MTRTSICAAALLLALQGCASQEPKDQAQNMNCVRDTGTRIAHDGCTAAPGRSYTREDLERTGSTNTTEALQRLDPSVSRH